MDSEKPRKLSIFRRISNKIGQIISKIGQKYSKSTDLQSFVGIVLDIIFLGILITLTYLGIVNGNILLKIFGFGSGFWLIKNKIVPMIIEILNSFRIVGIK